MPHNASIHMGIAWCLAWGDQKEPNNISNVQQLRDKLKQGSSRPEELRPYIEWVDTLDTLDFPHDLHTLPSSLLNLETKIGLVYGGATKIKQYVFESAKLPEIRGASALLDRINLVDLPAFFHGEDSSRFPQCQKDPDYCQQLRNHFLDPCFPGLSEALIPELIIYSTGGNILTFCPAAFVTPLANAIEKRYTQETLTANACAVGETFRLLELRLGLLQYPIEHTFWLDRYLQHIDEPLVQAYFPDPKEFAAQDSKSPEQQAFESRKSFSELVTHLATHFNQRRSGNPRTDQRPSRCYPPMFETHPYLQRDGSDRRSAITQAKSDPNDPTKGLPGDPWFSEPLARKRLMGQITKREVARGDLPQWYKDAELEWEPGNAESWVSKFEQFVVDEELVSQYDQDQNIFIKNRLPQYLGKQEARSLKEIADASHPPGFVGYIYADGNNVGGYIQSKIKTPQAYQAFSQDLFSATEKAVYKALVQHLHPHLCEPDIQSSRRNAAWIHPFEILTIGGDDVMLIVPADKALAIAQTLAEEFENRLRNCYKSELTYESQQVHRYQAPRLENASKWPDGKNQCELSMSAGVLITAQDTPIYYAERLTGQLLKLAKKKAKDLKKFNYSGGTVDFLVMKSVTMISSNINSFREAGLIKGDSPQLKLYAAPYTLHELKGLLTTAQTLKEVDFPRSQLYQLRGLLERGKHTAMLNYRYFRVRLKTENHQKTLAQYFEQAWCEPKDKKNTGNLAPWQCLRQKTNDKPAIYETIWRELVDLYPFTPEPTQHAAADRSERRPQEQTP